MFALIGGTLLLRASAAGNATLNLVASDTDIQPGEDVALELRLDTDDEDVNAVQATLIYNAAVFDLVSIVDEPLWSVEVDDISPGSITLVKAIAGDSANGPNELVTTVTLRALDTTATDSLQLTGGIITRFSDSSNVFASATGATVTVDNLSPSASVLSPTNGAMISGTTTIDVSAQDNIAVDRVDIVVDTTVVQTISSPPYTLTYDTNGLVDGSHMINAVVYDRAGNVGSSSMVTFSTDNTAPTVSITQPSDAVDVAGSVTIAATAFDLEGVDRVEFFVDGVQISTDSTEPYESAWNTTAIADGTHTIRTRAFDGVGSFADSVTITVNVDNTAPTLTFDDPPADASVVNDVTLSASANDASGVTQVDFLVDGVVVGSDNTAPFSYVWDSSTAANGTVALSATATDTLGNSVTSAPVTVTVDNLAGDVNGSGRVDIFDLSLLLNNWLQTENLGRVDTNRDGIINIFDLSLLLAQWLQTTP